MFLPLRSVDFSGLFSFSPKSPSVVPSGFFVTRFVCFWFFVRSPFPCSRQATFEDFFPPPRADFSFFLPSTAIPDVFMEVSFPLPLTSFEEFVPPQAVYCNPGRNPLFTSTFSHRPAADRAPSHPSMSFSYQFPGCVSLVFTLVAYLSLHLARSLFSSHQTPSAFLLT